MSDPEIRLVNCCILFAAALFFLSYEASKAQLSQHSRISTTANHMLSSSIGEVVSLVKESVPFLNHFSEVEGEVVY